MFKLDLEKGRGTRDPMANIHWITEKAREFQKNICFIDYDKAFDCVDYNKLWKILPEFLSGVDEALTRLNEPNLKVMVKKTVVLLAESY